jgi:hypothetical protein
VDGAEQPELRADGPAEFDEDAVMQALQDLVAANNEGQEAEEGGRFSEDDWDLWGSSDDDDNDDDDNDEGGELPHDGEAGTDAPSRPDPNSSERPVLAVSRCQLPSRSLAPSRVWLCVFFLKSVIYI